jgi:hypothetical protein
MNKKKTPLELVSYFKNKEAKKEDGSDMNDSEKRKAALDKARRYKKTKEQQERKVS